MITILINLLVLCLVAGLFYWILGMLPLPPPIKQVATIVLVVIVVIALIYMLLGIAGGVGGYHGLALR